MFMFLHLPHPKHTHIQIFWHGSKINILQALINKGMFFFAWQFWKLALPHPLSGPFIKLSPSPQFPVQSYASVQHKLLYMWKSTIIRIVNITEATASVWILSGMTKLQLNSKWIGSWAVPKLIWGGCDHMVVGLSTTYAISDITTNVVSSNTAQARCTSCNIMW